MTESERATELYYEYMLNMHIYTLLVNDNECTYTHIGEKLHVHACNIM